MLGGEAASLREAPLPPDPSLPKSGWRLACAILLGWFRLRVGAGFCELVEVTAADRAAVTFVALGNEPLRPPRAGTSPFRGGFAGSAAKRLPPQRELSEVPYSAYGIGKSL